MTYENELMPKLRAFHAHLDQCRWCAEHAFNLCDAGAHLLLEASREADAWLDTWTVTRERAEQAERERRESRIAPGVARPKRV